MSIETDITSQEELHKEAGYPVAGQVNYFIIPFAYKKDYHTAIKEIDPKTWQMKKVDLGNLFEHIKNLVVFHTEETDRELAKAENIGWRFVLSQSARNKCGLTSNWKTLLKLYREKNLCQKKGNEKSCQQNINFLRIKETELYLFETNIGFINIEVEFLQSLVQTKEEKQTESGVEVSYNKIRESEGANIEDIIEGGYYFKKLRVPDYKLFVTEKTKEKDVKETPIEIGKLVRQWIEEFGPETFFEGKHDLPVNCLVYSGVILDKQFNELERDKEEKIKEYLFMLRRSFKDSYRPSKCELALENNPEVYQPFENSYWGVSLEGFANLSYLTGREDTNKFFQGNFLSRVKTSYYYLDILALHQRFALLYLSIRASRLPDPDFVTDSNDYQELLDLKSEIVHFNLRSLFKQASAITHQEKVYEMICRTLRIEDLKEELHTEMESLSMLKDMEREKNRRDFEFNIGLVTTLFVIISTLTDGYSLSEAVYKGIINNTIPGGWYVILGMIVVMMTLAVRQLWKIRPRKKKRKTQG